MGVDGTTMSPFSSMMPPIGPRSRKRTVLTGVFLILILMVGAAGCAPAGPEAAATEENLLETLVAEAVETQRVEGQEQGLS